MYLIIGLGNPERDYAGTRHNVGFEVIKQLAQNNGININKLKCRAFVGEGVIHGEKVLLALPQTYMNLSGESVRGLMAYYKLGLDRLIVVYDDTALPVGKIRLREKGSAGGHNGIKNILFQLESDDFLRIKVGIGEKPTGRDLADYVLSRFNKSELDNITSSTTDAADAIEYLIAHGAVAAMNKYNPKPTKQKEEPKGEENNDN